MFQWTCERLGILKIANHEFKCFTLLVILRKVLLLKNKHLKRIEVTILLMCRTFNDDKQMKSQSLDVQI